jgi:hypothetical protein
MVDYLELLKPESDGLVSESQPVDERTMRSIQQNYQVSHQEEFLRLKTQAEILLTELRKFGRHQSDNAEFTL